MECDPTLEFELHGRRAPGMFFGSTARDMAVPIKAETSFDTAAGDMLVDNKAMTAVAVARDIGGHGEVRATS